MDVDADLSQIVTVQAAVTLTFPDKTKFMQFGLLLQKDGTATDTCYRFYVVASNSRANATDVTFEIYKVTAHSAVSIAGPSAVETWTNGTMAFTWDPATDTLTGYKDGVQKVQVVDANITANTRSGMDAASNDPGMAIVVDNFLLDPVSTTQDVSTSDSLTLSDAAIKQIDKVLAEALGLSEGFTTLKVVLTDLGDAVSLTDGFAVQVGKGLADTVSLTETFTKRVDKALTETIALTESRLLTIAKPLAETVSLSEGFQTLKVVIQDLGDAVSLTDGFAVQVGKGLADTVSLTETFTKQVDKALVDTIALTEARLLFVAKPLAETVGLSEGFEALKVVLQDVNDTVSLAEALAVQMDKALTETMALTEARLLTASKTLGDTLGITEALAKFITKVRGETIGLTEQLTPTMIPGGGGGGLNFGPWRLHYVHCIRGMPAMILPRRDA